MPYSLEYQLKFLSPQVFEELCGQLIMANDPVAYHMDGSSGDEGIDILLGSLDAEERARTGGKLHVWQVKCFPTGLGEGQRQQVRDSLKRVVEAHHPDSWTLCIPVGLKPGDHKWLNNLREDYPDLIRDPLEAGHIVSRLHAPENEALLSTYFLRASDTDYSGEWLRCLEHFDLVEELLDKGRRSPKPRSDFYEGATADWYDIYHRLDAPREAMADLWDFVRESAETAGGRVPFAILTGQSGEGKSTVLMRLAAELVEQGYRAVYWLRPEMNELSPVQFRGLPDGALVFIFVDRITRFDADQLAGFLEGLRSIPIRPVVIGAAITSLWNVFGCNVEDSAAKHEIEMEPMSRRDIEALLDKLTENEATANRNLGKLAGLSRDEQISKLTYDANRQLLVALIEAKGGLGFDKHINDELAQLSKDPADIVRRACIYVSALHCHDLPMPELLLDRLLGGKARLHDTVFRKTSGLVELISEGKSVVTRHSLVAKVIFKSVANARLEWYKEIIAKAEQPEAVLISRLIHTIRLLEDKTLAGDLLTAASAKFHNDPYFHQMRATLLREQGNVPAARLAFQDGVKAAPRNAPTWQAWALLEKDEGNIGDKDKPEEYSARWLFREGVKAAPKDAPLWQAWARLEEDQRNIGDKDKPKEYGARWLFHEGVKADPKHAHLWQGWALLEKEQRNAGDKDEPEEYSARWLFREGVKADPKDAHLWQAWALFEKAAGNLGNEGDPEENSARWLFREGVKADPKDAFLWQAWALMEKDAGNVGDKDKPEKHSARWLFQEGVKADPRNAPLWRSWALLEKDSENWVEAERFYNMAAEVTTDDRDKCRLYCDLSYMIFPLGRKDDAIRYLEQAVEANGRDHIAHARLARSYGYKGLWEKAELHFRVSLDLRPNDRKTQQWYDNMQYRRSKYERH